MTGTSNKDTGSWSFEPGPRTPACCPSLACPLLLLQPQTRGAPLGQLAVVTEALQKEDALSPAAFFPAKTICILPGAGHGYFCCDCVERSERQEGSLRVTLFVCVADAVTQQWACRSRSTFPSCWLGPALTGGERRRCSACAGPRSSSRVPRIITYTQSLRPNVYAAAEDESARERSKPQLL